MRQMSFSYDDRGYGVLSVYDGTLVVKSVRCRTGSINKKGALVNAIRPGVWTIKKPSVDTTEPGMINDAGIGWKVRMWTPEGEWSHYLIHPDGGKGGTRGCIGILKEDLSMRECIDETLLLQETIRVYINKPIPREVDDVYTNKKTGISINYSRLRGMDIFMTANMLPSGIIIRLVRLGVRKMFSMKHPNHTGFVTENSGQFFATEMRMSGIAQRSLNVYTKKSNRIIRVWRWKRFDNDLLRARAQEHLARLIRIQLEYDTGGLVAFTRVIKRVLPWVKNSNKKDFCSENGFLVLKRFGLRGYPSEWDSRPPAPDELDSFFLASGEFRQISAVG